MDEDPLPSQPAPPPPPDNDSTAMNEPAGRDADRRFRRRAPQKLGGVSSGLAHYLGVDANFFRIGFVILALATEGMGVVLYAAAWLLVPDESDSDPRPLTVTTNVPALISGLAILLVGSLFISNGVTFFDEGVVIPLVLVGLGFYILNQRSDTRLRQDAPPPAPPQRPGAPAPAPSAWPTAPTPAAFAPASPAPVAPNPIPPNAFPPVAPNPPVSNWAVPRVEETPQPGPVGPPITSITLASLAVVVGALLVTDNIAGVDISVSVMVGAALAVLGAGLIASALFERALGLFPLAFLTAAVLSVAPLLDTTLSGGVGTRNVKVELVQDLQPKYSLGLGEMVVDLRELRPETDRTVEIAVGAGYAEILVPSNVDVEVRATNRAGYIEALRIDDEGLFNEVRHTSRGELDPAAEPGDEPPKGLLTIVADVTFGYVEVRRG